MAATRKNSRPSFCVYCSPDEINDATFRYLEVIRRGLRTSGLEDLGVTQDAQRVRDAQVILTISCLPALRAMVRHPRADIVHWFQGIEAEERRFLHRGWRGQARWLLWSAMEVMLLRRARVKLFVSQEMREFLGDPEDSRSVVIPCYNADLNPAAWARGDRYQRLDLVYAGSLYPWQCVEDTLLAYKAIRGRRADASLTLFTREIDRARAMCERHGIEDVHIESVTPLQLIEALTRFSFGFILREEMAINRVSTPTKFSSYLSAGVIPVMTRATPALARMAGQCAYQVVASSPSAHEEIAERVLAIAGEAPRPEAVRSAFEEIFSKHFDDARNAQRVADRMTEA